MRVTGNLFGFPENGKNLIINKAIGKNKYLFLCDDVHCFCFQGMKITDLLRNLKYLIMDYPISIL